MPSIITDQFYRSQCMNVEFTESMKGAVLNIYTKSKDVSAYMCDIVYSYIHRHPLIY